MRAETPPTLDSLPPKLIRKLVLSGHLSVKSIIALSRVSKKLNQAIDQPAIWQKISTIVLTSRRTVASPRQTLFELADMNIEERILKAATCGYEILMRNLQKNRSQDFRALDSKYSIFSRATMMRHPIYLMVMCGHDDMLLEYLFVNDPTYLRDIAPYLRMVGADQIIFRTAQEELPKISRRLREYLLSRGCDCSPIEVMFKLLSIAAIVGIEKQ